MLNTANYDHTVFPAHACTMQRTGFSYVFSQEVNIRCIFGRVIRQKILGAIRRVFDVCLMHFKWIALVIRRTYAISLSSISIDAVMWQGDSNRRIHPLPSDLVFPSRRLSCTPNCTFISDTLMRCVLYRWWARVLFLLLKCDAFNYWCF